MLRKLLWLQVENRALTPEVHLLIQHWSHVIQVHFIVSVSFQFSSVVWQQKYLVSEAIVTDDCVQEEMEGMLVEENKIKESLYEKCMDGPETDGTEPVRLIYGETAALI